MTDIQLKKALFRLPNGSYITPYTDCKGALEVCDIGMSLFVDETQGLRRYLNGQIVERNNNTEEFFTRLQQITTLYPSLLCTEEEWQAAKTLSAFGQVGKFVFNYSGDNISSVRIPAIVNVQGLFDLQKLGMTVAESLPNHTHYGYSSNNDVDNANSQGYPYGNKHRSYRTTDRSGSMRTTLQMSYASSSNSIYKDNAHVQQEAVQFPYFIQIAQGQYTMKTIRNDWEINNPYTIFDAKQSQYPLNNASWLKSLGQWNEKSVYTYAYEALLVELNNSIETNTTVDLPSGGKYTKHLQTVNFDVNKVNKVKFPVIEEGILTPTDTDYVQLKIGENVLNTAKSWQLDLLCQISSDYIIATDYSSDYIPFAINKNTLIINNSLNTFNTISNGWKYVRVKYNDSTGYEVYTSDDGTAFDLITSVEKVDKIDYAGNNLNLKGTPVDLHTVQFKYDLGNGVEHLVTTGVEYKSVVWNKAEHTTSEADYAYNFIVDVVNESFRLPLYDKVFNNPYADLYYFIGDTLQNTSLIDLGRISESVTVNKSEIEKLRILIGQIAGDIPTVETSTYGARTVTLYNGTDLGNHVIDLSSYIPLDGHQYDVYGYIYWAVGDTSGNDRNAYIYDASGTNKLYQLSVDGVVSPNAGNCTDTWQVPLPVNSRTITLRLTGTSDSKFSKFQLVLLWFRKY